MTVREHADRTEALLGNRAEDIHRWIDRYFDAEGFADFLRRGFRPGYDPYAHRRHRHCREALEEARREFEGAYAPELIDAVVERHIRDDYDGYFPYREDFEKGDFREKYHESGSPAQSDSSLPAPDDLAAYFRGKHYETMARSTRRRGIRFLWRFILPVITAMVLLLGSLFIVIVPLSRENMLDLEKTMIRELTAVAIGALEHYASHVREGLMSDEEARYEAAEEIRRMRYGEGNKEYYWIIDSKALMVMHPYRSELEGQDMSAYRDREDAAGVYLFREAARLALAEGDGFIEYWWQHWDDPSALAPKLSYVRYFPEWDWIVGTGIYINDVEEETDRLARRLGAVFGGISLVSITLLFWVLAGALKVERRRDEAEEGLREVKERYRALAEASSEGYMLVSGGAALYANPALCRITGRSEEELLSSGPLALLDGSQNEDHPARLALGALKDGEAPSGFWTVSLLRKDGTVIEAGLGISRIFLPGSNGHVVSIRRPMTAGERIGIPEPDRYASPDDNPDFMKAISTAEDRVAVLDAVAAMGEELTRQLGSGAPAAGLRATISRTYDAALSRFADLASGTAGLPEPARVAILSLGSNARREMTPFSDQDAAIIFAEIPGIPPEEIRRGCLNLGIIIADGLESAGFPKCDGGVMPMNPRWCLSETEWSERIGEWTADPRPQSLLELNVVLDRRHAWGEKVLSEHLDDMLMGLGTRSPGLVRLYRENAMLYRPPLLLRKKTGPLDVKEALKPLEIQLRLLSLIHGIRAVGTLERLNALHAAGVIHGDSATDLRIAFETLWNLRLRMQLEGHRQPIRTDDTVNPDDLSGLERGNLTACLEAVDAFVKRRAMEADRI